MLREVLSVALGIVFVTPLSASAFARKQSENRYLMAAMGDSITAAFIANTETSRASERELGQKGIEEFLIEQLLEYKDTLSWASGREINSHFVRLQDHLRTRDASVELDVLNVAVSGSVARDIKAQALKISNLMKSGEYKALKYVTLLIGANDACIGTSTSQMFEDLKLALNVLSQIKQDESIKILVSSLPAIPELGKEAIIKHKTLGFFSCEYIRSKVLKLCNSLTHWDSDEAYFFKLKEVDEKNLILQQVVDDANRDYPNLEVSFSASFRDVEIEIDRLALDCFHPNKKGQEALSDIMWRDQPFFK